MAEQGTALHTHPPLAGAMPAVGALSHGVPGGYGMADHSGQIQGRMGVVSHGIQGQVMQPQTPFHQRDLSQQYPSQATGQQDGKGFGKVKSGGHTLADYRDSWRSKSESWRSGGGDQQGFSTWRANSSGGWRGAGEHRGAQGGHHVHEPGQLGHPVQPGYQGHSNQANAMISATSAMSLNGRTPGTLQGEQTLPVPPTFGTGGGWYGMMPFGPSRSVHRYPTEVLARLYKQMLYAGRLRLPNGVQRDEPMLFTPAGEFVDVFEQLQGVPVRPKNAYIDLTSGYASRENSGGSIGRRQKSEVAHGGPTSLQQEQQKQVLPASLGLGTHVPRDMYTYVDPQGQWQGPFTRAEMLEWHASGFFPLSLVVRAVDPPQMVSTLSDWLALWNGSTPMVMSIPDNPQPTQSYQAVQSAQNYQAVQNHQAAVSVQSQPLQAPPRQLQNQHEELHGHVQVTEPAVEPSPVDPILGAEAEKGWAQEEEEEELPAELEAPVADKPQTAPDAPWLGSLSIENAISLKDIQLEEDARKAENDEIKAKVVAQQQKLRSSQSGWVSVAKSESLSLADIQNEEINAHSQRTAIEAADAAASLVKHQQKMASGGMWAAAASKPAAIPSVTPALRTAAKKTVQTAAAPPPPPPAEKSRAVSQTVPPPRPQADASLPIESMAFGLEAPSAEEAALSGDFRDWCSQQMQSLTGSDEVTLCEFLMGVESNSEIADYVGMYLGTSAAVAPFSAEFIKRKLAVMAAREMTAAGKRKSRKARAKANKALASVSAGTDGSAPTKKDVDDSSWEKVAKGGKGLGASTDKLTSSGLAKSRPAGASGFALLSSR